MFAFAVPMTIVAFILGGIFVEGLGEVLLLDYAMVTLTMVGVFIYNWYEEKPVQISIQKT